MKTSQAQVLEELRLRVAEFPTQSGVYLMKSAVGKVIYVGKAKNLRNRVRSYFGDRKDHAPKTIFLMSHAREIDFIITKTEVEAFLLEASLIKKHRPKYNIRLKDDKAYPYIQLTWQEKFPRLYVARRVKKDGSLYFGPYTSGLAVHGTIRLLNRTFKVRDCTDAVFKTRKRPCLTHQIGRCGAPCVSLITEIEYRQDVEGALDFLRGKNKELLGKMTERMSLMAEEEKFEVAARLRDSIRAIQSILERQSVVSTSAEKDVDAIGFYGDERGTLIETVHVRAGRMIGTRSHFFPLLNPEDPAEDAREWLISFLNQYYEDNIIPDEILLTVDVGLEVTKLFESVLKSRSGQIHSVRFPTEEVGRDLIDRANDTAKKNFEKYVTRSELKKEGLLEIQKKLSLPQFPTRIECYDISTFQGSETVASQVVFEEGVPNKDQYRRYKIRSVTGIDDFASMKEVLTRRFQHLEYEDPQLIVIDGGKGQLSIAIRVLTELGKQHLPVVGLAKSRTESDFTASEVAATQERFYLPGRSNPVIFRDNSEAHHILVGIRDEAHRFAIGYHRKLREAASLESELDLVVGLGEKRKKDLLRHFGSVEAVKAASAEEIAEIPGFHRVLAERILLQLLEREEEIVSD